MQRDCYTISKSDTGWIIWAAGSAVLYCKSKRTALAAIRRTHLMLDDEAPLARRRDGHLRAGMRAGMVAGRCRPRDK